MGRILLVSRNALRGIFHARSLYLWLIGILVVGIQLAPQIIFRNNAPGFIGAGPQRPLPPGMSEDEQKQFRELEKKRQEAQMQQIQEAFRRGRPRTFAGGMRLWSFLSIAFGILMGSSMLGNEVNAKTIITVLARPIARWELLLGKWIAIQVFGVMSLMVGTGIYLVVGSYLDISFNRLLLLALLHAEVSIMLYSAAGIALSTVVGTAVSGGLTVVVALLPDFIPFMKEAGTHWIHLTGVVLDYIVPPGFRSLFVNSVDATLELDRSAMSKTLLENVLFCAVFFIVGCILYSRREVRLG